MPLLEKLFNACAQETILRVSPESLNSEHHFSTSDQNINNDIKQDDTFIPIESITNQINMIFANRSDLYWLYDFQKMEIIALHDLFLLDFTSLEFVNKMQRAIEVFEPRVADIKIKITRDIGGFFIKINGFYKRESLKISFPEIRFAL